MQVYCSNFDKEHNKVQFGVRRTGSISDCFKSFGGKADYCHVRQLLLRFFAKILTGSLPLRAFFASLVVVRTVI